MAIKPPLTAVAKATTTHFQPRKTLNFANPGVVITDEPLLNQTTVDLSGVATNTVKVQGVTIGLEAAMNFLNTFIRVFDDTTGGQFDIQIGAEAIDTPVSLIIDPEGSDAPTRQAGAVGGPGETPSANPCTAGAPDANGIQTLTFNAAHGLPVGTAGAGFRIALFGAPSGAAGNNGSGFEIVDAPTALTLRIRNASGAADATLLSWSLAVGFLNTNPGSWRALVQNLPSATRYNFSALFNPGIYDFPAELARLYMPTPLQAADPSIVKATQVAPGVKSVNAGTRAWALRGPLQACVNAGPVNVDATVTAAANGLATITVPSGTYIQAHRGRYAKFTLGIGANTGTFLIDSVPGATSIIVRNPNAVVDATVMTCSLASVVTVTGTGTAADGTYTVLTMTADRQGFTSLETPGASFDLSASFPRFVGMVVSRYTISNAAAGTGSSNSGSGAILDLADPVGLYENSLQDHDVSFISGTANNIGSRLICMRSYGTSAELNGLLPATPAAGDVVQFEQPPVVIRSATNGMGFSGAGATPMALLNIAWRVTGTSTSVGAACGFFGMNVQCEGCLFDGQSDSSTTNDTNGGLLLQGSQLNSSQTAFFSGDIGGGTPFDSHRANAGIILRGAAISIQSSRIGDYPLYPAVLERRQNNNDTFWSDCFLSSTWWQDARLTMHGGRFSTTNPSNWENALFRAHTGTSCEATDNFRIFGCAGRPPVPNNTPVVSMGTAAIVGGGASIGFQGFSGGAASLTAQNTTVTIAASTQPGVFLATLGTGTLTQAMLFRNLLLSNTTTAANAGSWPILQVISTTQCLVAGLAGADALNANAAWAVASNTNYANAGYGTVVENGGLLNAANGVTTSLPTVTGLWGDVFLGNLPDAVNTSNQDIFGLPYRWNDATRVSGTGSVTLGTGNSALTLTPLVDRCEFAIIRRYGFKLTRKVSVIAPGTPYMAILIFPATDAAGAISGTETPNSLVTDLNAGTSNANTPSYCLASVTTGTGAGTLAATTAVLSGTAASAHGQLTFEARGGTHTPVFLSVLTRFRGFIVADAGNSKRSMRMERPTLKTPWGGSGSDTFLTVRNASGQLLVEGTDYENKSTFTNSANTLTVPAGFIPRYNTGTFTGTDFMVLPGDWISITGQVTKPENNGLWKVVSVTATTIVVDTTNGSLTAFAGPAEGKVELLNALNILQTSATQNQFVTAEITAQTALGSQVIAGAVCIAAGGAGDLATATAEQISFEVNKNQAGGQGVQVTVAGATCTATLNQTANGAGTVVRAGSTVTVTPAVGSHPYSVGEVIYCTSLDGNFPGGPKLITATTGTTFSYIEAGAAVASIANITYTAKVTSSMVGRYIRIAGSTTADNDGFFPILTVNQGTQQITYSNPNAAPNAENDANAVWSILDDVGSRTSAVFGGTGKVAVRAGSGSLYSMGNRVGGLANGGNAQVALSAGTR